MPATETQSIAPADRLSNLRYAIRDLAVAAEQLVKQGHKVLYLNVGAPNIFDFSTPPHAVEGACQARSDNRDGQAPKRSGRDRREGILEEGGHAEIRIVDEGFGSTGGSEG